jgi:hypothetical protein
MGHTHEEDKTTFYVAELSTIGICGLLGVVCILLYQQNLLRFVLAENRHFVVPVAGAILLVLVSLRALVLFASAGRSAGHEGHDHDHDHHDHDHDHDHNHDHDHEHEHEHGADGASVHDHDHDCCHEHVHAGHDHGHDHDHGFNPWRYIILLLPIVLYFLNMPNAGFTAAYSKGSGISAGDLSPEGSGKYPSNTGLQITKAGGAEFVQVAGVAKDSPADKAGIKIRDVISEVKPLDDANSAPVSLKGKSLDEAAKLIGGKPDTKVKLTVQREGEDKTAEITRAMDVLVLEFKQLENATYAPQSREYYTGKTVRLKGQFRPGQNDRMFSLVRYKITCCAADAIPLNVVIMLDPQSKEGLGDVKALEWVEVTGRVDFRTRRDRPDEYLTVLTVASPSDITKAEPDLNPYLQ